MFQEIKSNISNQLNVGSSKKQKIATCLFSNSIFKLIYFILDCYMFEKKARWLLIRIGEWKINSIYSKFIKNNWEDLKNLN